MFQQSFAETANMFGDSPSSTGFWTTSRRISSMIDSSGFEGARIRGGATKRLPFGQHNSLAALLNLDGKSTLYQ